MVNIIKEKVDKFEEFVNFFKNLWNELLKFFKDKFFSSNEYDDLIEDLYNEDIFDDTDIEKDNFEL